MWPKINKTRCCHLLDKPTHTHTEWVAPPIQFSSMKKFITSIFLYIHIEKCLVYCTTPKKPSILIINLWWTGQSSKILQHVVGGSSVFAKNQEERTGLHPPACPQPTPKNYRCIITRVQAKSSTKPKHGCDHCGHILKCMIVKT